MAREGTPQLTDTSVLFGKSRDSDPGATLARFFGKDLNQVSDVQSQSSVC
jgi:hypothetical protein